MKPALLLLLITLLHMSPLQSAAPTSAQYQAKVTFQEKKAISFPDFMLTYLGKRQIPPPAGLRGWSFHDFAVKADGKEQKVSWSSGTGDIGPTEFKVGRKTFLLEMGISDTLGKLKQDEVVVRVKK